MKIIQFTIPATKEKNIQVQEDDLPHFYEQLHHHYEIQVTCVIIPVGALVTYYHRQPFSAGDIFILGANQPVFFKTDASYFEGNSNKHIHTLDIFFTLTGFITSWPEFHEIRSIKKFMYLFLYRFQASGNKATLLEK